MMFEKTKAKKLEGVKGCRNLKAIIWINVRKSDMMKNLRKMGLTKLTRVSGDFEVVATTEAFVLGWDDEEGFKLVTRLDQLKKTVEILTKDWRFPKQLIEDLVTTSAWSVGDDSGPSRGSVGDVSKEEKAFLKRLGWNETEHSHFALGSVPKPKAKKAVPKKSVRKPKAQQVLALCAACGETMPYHEFDEHATVCPAIPRSKDGESFPDYKVRCAKMTALFRWANGDPVQVPKGCAGCERNVDFPECVDNEGSCAGPHAGPRS